MPSNAAPLLNPNEFEGLKRGDHKVFKKVYDAYFGLIFYIVGRCGVRGEERNDIVQEVFIKLLNQGAAIQNRESLKGWLATCARNLSIDCLRKKRMVNVDGEELENRVEEDAPLKRERQLRLLEVELLSSLIEKVCETENDETMKLFYVDGLSAKEISELKKEPISTITNRISRMRKKFKTHFAKHIIQLREEKP